jgi:hypothetical protein
MILYFLVPHRFRPESAGMAPESAGIHRNGTGIGILEVYYDMQVYISVVWCYLVIHNTITQLHTSVCY